jgi:hypothetical protein
LDDSRERYEAASVDIFSVDDILVDLFGETALKINRQIIYMN